MVHIIPLSIAQRPTDARNELQRQLGVTYKTAYRMGMKIRELIGSTQDFDMLQGHVEMDEAYVGGYRPARAVAVRKARPL